MTERYPDIHPDLSLAADRAPRFAAGRKNLWLFRTLLKLMPGSKSHADLRRENIRIPHPDGRTRIRLRIYRPAKASEPTPVLLWLHGGGYVMGIPEMDDAACAEFVHKAGVSVVSVDYRVAPEYPFPAALEDSYAALEWVVAHAAGRNFDAARIAVGGRSAGGGVAASLAQLAHDRGELPVVFQLLVYPMLDDRTSFCDDPVPENRIAWCHESNRFGWDCYLGTRGGAQDVPEYAVPARRENLAGLPPAWIGVGTGDVFHNENVAYIEKLRAGGVDGDLLVVPGAFHGFDAIAPEAPVARDFREAQVEALKKYLSIQGND